ncbi:chromosome partition protein Smc [Clostridium homopropionicum DSM 5847]|uniref:Chromosome partition protein Smc n=1 Tax=Clostridium homopropionicum DSM 5847 TaxID=1121318 RepID=A0A0L6Z6W7_9CLOT|nr:hypothetical protein [Clostridium homopropionicum]KOA18699.1 chromosome partition protein Smc [Clostridium homopropionicum DSM 5847]SFG53093.1 N-terminal domain of peptidoglycan hydrolase CwlO-containing protein [Clostridium homopropionicum]
MVKEKHSRLIFILIVVLTFSFIGAENRVSADVKPIEEVQNKLKGISEKERSVLENLFKLTQEVEDMEREEAKANSEIGALKLEIKELESKIQKQQKEYDDKLKVLEMVLVSYQRSGPASYLETLLKAENLTSFIRSINIIRDFSRNVGELLDSVDEGRKKLSEEKDKLTEKISVIDNKNKVLQESLDKKRKLKEEQQAYLDSFKEDKAHYETQLKGLEQMWKEIKVIFSDIVKDFRKIVQEGYFPQSKLNLSFKLPIIKGALYEETFNDVIKNHSNLPNMVFHFYQDKVVIEVPDKHLVLDGKFVIQGKTAFKLKVDKGSFYGIPLETSSIEELFKNGDLLIDIKDLAGDKLIFDIYVQSIKMKEGYLEFEVKVGA